MIIGYAHVDTLLNSDIPIKVHVEKGNKIKMIEKPQSCVSKKITKTDHTLTYQKERIRDNCQQRKE